MKIASGAGRAAKRPTNLSVNGDLLNQARELGINLSAILEEALATEVRSRRRERWLEENQEAIAAYNEHVAQNGVWSDGPVARLDPQRFAIIATIDFLVTGI